MDNKTDFKQWIDENISYMVDAMRQCIDVDNPSSVYGNGERAVMSLTFTDGDELGVGAIADAMLLHYRCEVARRMGDEVNRRQSKGGYPLEFAMTRNTELLSVYYNLCARYARQRGEDCVVSVARY